MLAPRQSKALFFKDVTEAGKSIIPIGEDEKAVVPIEVIVFGRTRLVRLEQSAKAFISPDTSQIDVIFVFDISIEDMFVR